MLKSKSLPDVSHENIPFQRMLGLMQRAANPAQKVVLRVISGDITGMHCSSAEGTDVSQS